MALHSLMTKLAETQFSGGAAQSIGAMAEILFQAGWLHSQWVLGHVRASLSGGVFSSGCMLISIQPWS